MLTQAEDRSRAVGPSRTVGPPPGVGAAGRVLGVVAASALVAIGAEGAGSPVGPPVVDGTWVRGVRLAGTALAAAGLGALLLQRRRFRTAGRPGPEPTVPALVMTATVMSVLAVLALFAPAGLVTGTGTESAGGGGARVSADAAPTSDPPTAPPSSLTEGFRLVDDPPEPAQPSPEAPRERRAAAAGAGLDPSLLRRTADLLLAVVVLGLALVAVRVLLDRWRSPRRAGAALPTAGAPDDDGVAAEAEATGLPTPPSGPLGPITAAYQRLLEALAAAGAGRMLHEAPYEHLRRTLPALGVDPDPPHRLAGLYVRAQFGRAPPTELDGRGAARALEGSLSALVARTPRPPGDGARELPGEAGLPARREPREGGP